MENLKFRRISVITPGHSQIAEEKLGKESQIKANKSDDRCHLTQKLGIKPAGDLRPPVVQSTHERHNHPADHNVMKMRDHKVGVSYMHIDRERGQEQAGQPADGKQSDEAQRIKHWRLKADRSLV